MSIFGLSLYRTSFTATSHRLLSSSSIMNTMGEKIPGLDIFKDQDPVVFKERQEYPDWVHKLAVPHVPLAKLRKMEVEEATDNEMFRYLKLTRRIQIKEANLNAGQK